MRTFRAVSLLTALMALLGALVPAAASAMDQGAELGSDRAAWSVGADDPGARPTTPPAGLSIVLPGAIYSLHVVREPVRDRLFIVTESELQVLDTAGTILARHATLSWRAPIIIGRTVHLVTSNGFERYDADTLDPLPPFSFASPLNVTQVFAAGNWLWVSESGLSDGLLRVDIATGAMTTVPVPQAVAVSVFAVHDTQGLVSGNDEMTVWDFASGTPQAVRTITGTQGMGLFVRSPDGTRAFAAMNTLGPDRAPRLDEWDTTTWTPTGRRFDLAGVLPSRLLFSPDGSMLFMLGNNSWVPDTPSTLRIRTADLAIVGQYSRIDGPAAPATDNVRLYVVDQNVLRDYSIVPPPPPPPAAGAAFHPIDPVRLVDTRENRGVTGAFGPGRTATFRAVGAGGIPASGVTGVVLNVTATQPTSESYLTVWPAGVGRPVASSVNFRPGETVPNLVTTGVGAEGQVALFNEKGTVHVIVDVVGWYDDGYRYGATIETSRPTRVLDTRVAGTWGYYRDGVFNLGPDGPAPVDRLHAGERLTLVGTPFASAAAAIVNVTVVDPTADGYLTVWPAGRPRPETSSVNFRAGETSANLVIVGLGYDPAQVWRAMDISSPNADLDVIVDVMGWFTPTLNAGKFNAITPRRVLDTRFLEGLDENEAGVLQLPTDLRGPGIGSVALNVTVTGTTAASFLSVWPYDRPPFELTSNLNWPTGRTVANQVIVRVPEDGRLVFYNAFGFTHLIVDVVGWYTTA